MKKIFLMTAVSVLAMGAAQAMAEEATGTGQAKATIVSNVKITADASQPLDFGEIISTVEANEVTVQSSDNTRSASVANSLTGRESKAGKFNVNGSPNTEVTVSAANITSEGLTGPGDKMALGDFNVSGTTGDTLTLNAQGQGSFTVGGKLSVNAAQAPGEYTGDYTVTTSY